MADPELEEKMRWEAEAIAGEDITEEEKEGMKKEYDFNLSWD